MEDLVSVSPFDKLPEEILVHIFLFYVHSEGPKKFLLNISRVCKKWHHLGSMPQIWSVIRKSNLKLSDLVKLSEKGFLSHTRSLAISGSNEWGINWSSEEDTRLLSLIVNCNNLKAIRLSHLRRSRVLLALLRIRFPHLKSLELDCVCERSFGDFGKQWRGRINSNSLAPVFTRFRSHLKVISLSNIDITGEVPLFDAIASNCSNLEEFRFHQVYLNQELCSFPVLKFQQGCQRLRVLRLNGCHISVEEINDIEQIGFPYLETFEACGCYGLEYGGIYFILCKSRDLKTLLLSNCSNITYQSIIGIPSSKLNNLSIMNIPNCDPNLDKIVSNWKSTLRELHLIDMSSESIRNSLISLVNRNPNPLIEVIELRCLFYSNICHSVLQNVKKKCFKLREFSIWKQKTNFYFSEVEKVLI